MGKGAVLVNFTVEDKELVYKKAKELGQSANEYIRRAVLKACKSKRQQKGGQVVRVLGDHMVEESES